MASDHFNFEINISSNKNSQKTQIKNRNKPEKTNTLGISNLFKVSNTSPQPNVKLKTSKLANKSVKNSKPSFSSPSNKDAAQTVNKDKTSPIKKNTSKPTSQKKISSLFFGNPDVPEISLGKVVPKTEPLFSKTTFDKIPIHPHMVSCLRDVFNITKMTEVQRRSIPVLLEGKDALIKSLTGSGKTLAYAIPIMQSLRSIEPKLDRSSGLRALVITPTRELAIQSYECFQKLSRASTWIVPGCLMGGEKKKSEKARLRKGITVLIATPGRFLDHLDHTSSLNLENVMWFVIDEADRLMELGFEKSITQIENALREKNKAQRQTILLSATLTQGVEKLAGMSLKSPVRIDLGALDDTEAMTNETYIVPSRLKQQYIIVPTKLRLVALSAFLTLRCAKAEAKALVFFATQDLVDFHMHILSTVLAKLLTEAGTPFKFFRLHGNMSQQDRMEIFKKFRELKAGVLLCTDVASRGLDMPEVEWIVQFSAPSRAEDYVHRVGRTARIGLGGHSLLILLPSEIEYLKLLTKHAIKLKGMNLNVLLEGLQSLPLESHSKRRDMQGYASALQNLFEEEVYAEKELHNIAHKAFISYVRAYASYPRDLKRVLPFKELHLGHAAKSLCLREAPSALGVTFASMTTRPSRGASTSRGGGVKRKLTKDHGKLNLGPPSKRIKTFSSLAVSEFDSGLSDLPPL